MNILTRKKTEITFSDAQTVRWLSWLAYQMKKHDQTVFLIENIQPSWLLTEKQRRLYSIFIEIISYGLISLGIGFSLIVIFTVMIFSDTGFMNIMFLIQAVILFLLCITPIFALPVWGLWRLVNRIKKRDNLIIPVETINLSKPFKIYMVIITSILLIFVFFHLLVFIVYSVSTLSGDFIYIQNRILLPISTYMFGILLGLPWGIRTGMVTLKVSPNQGILNSRKISFFTFIIALGGLFIGLLSNDILFLGLNAFLGFVTVLRLGGLAVVYHYLLRLLLFRQGWMPLDYVEFLDYSAEELNFLQKVGGGYIFMHRYLLDHFADLWVEANSK